MTFSQSRNTVIPNLFRDLVPTWMRSLGTKNRCFLARAKDQGRLFAAFSGSSPVRWCWRRRSLHWRRRFSPFDWPAQQTGFFASCEAASLPRMILRASLPPGSFGASLPGMLFPESLLNGVGIASADVFRRLASCFNGNWPAPADVPAFNAPLCFFHRILHYKERRRHVLVCLTSCLKA